MTTQYEVQESGYAVEEEQSSSVSKAQQEKTSTYLVGDLSRLEVQTYNEGKGIKRKFAVDSAAGGFYLDFFKTSEGTRVFVHLDFNGKQVTKESYYLMLDQFTELTDYLKANGIDALYAATNSSKAYRFASLFGFVVKQIVTDEANTKVHQWILERKL